MGLEHLDPFVEQVETALRDGAASAALRGLDLHGASDLREQLDVVVQVAVS